MWSMKCRIIRVVNRPTRTVTKGLKKNVEAIPRKHSIDSLQKTAILGISHITRKVLQCGTGYLSSGDHRWFKRKKSVTRGHDDDDDDDNTGFSLSS
jgi:hypothetical protein